MNEKNEVTDLLSELKSIEGVNEHLQTTQVKLGKEIIKTRINLGWTQSKLVQLCNNKGIPISQLILSKMELGDSKIECEIYEKTLEVLQQNQ